jgi:hypothetical protein
MMRSMSVPVRQWRHIVFATRGSWLPGDPRAMRLQRRPSPPDAASAEAASGAGPAPTPPAAICLSVEERRLVGQTIVQHLTRHALHPRAVAVCEQHVHVLADLPARIELVQGIVAACKRHAADSLNRHPGLPLWMMGGRFVPLEDLPSVEQATQQLLSLAEQGAWIWCSEQAGST